MRERTVCNGKAQGFKILKTDSERQRLWRQHTLAENNKLDNPQLSDTNLGVSTKFLLNSWDR